MKDDRKRGIAGEEEDSFIGRWSRRKTAAREGNPLPEPVSTSVSATRTVQPQDARPPAEKRTGEPDGSGAAAAEGGIRPELPSLDSLRGLDSEYREFLRSDVDEGTRRAALKKLFADPHFNRMDGLDVYIDDYSKADPIPAAMLRTLSHAKELLFPESKEGANEAARHGPVDVDENPDSADAAARHTSPRPDRHSDAGTSGEGVDGATAPTETFRPDSTGLSRSNSTKKESG